MHRFFLCCLALCSFAVSAIANEAEVPKPNYVYRAELVGVVDDHTVALNLDLGFGVWLHNQNLPLLGIATAQESDRSKTTARLRELLVDRSEITLQSLKDKKTGQYQILLWADGININEEMKKVAAH